MREKKRAFKALEPPVNFLDPKVMFWFFDNLPDDSGKKTTTASKPKNGDHNNDPNNNNNNNNLHNNNNNNFLKSKNLNNNNNNDIEHQKNDNLLVKKRKTEASSSNENSLEDDDHPRKSLRNQKNPIELKKTRAKPGPKPQTKKNDEKSLKFKHKHPLIDHVPPLSDIQCLITEVLMDSETSLSFEEIYEYVQDRWDDIKRKDGSSYSSDCKRALQANLRNKAQAIPLFQRDPHDEEKFTVTREIPSVEKRSVSIKKELETPQDSHEEEEEEDDEVEEEESDEYESEERMKEREEKEKRAMQLATYLAAQCINENGGSCPFSLMLHFVCKRENMAELQVEQSQIRSILLKVLTKGNSFKRDESKTGWWKIKNSDDPANHEKKEDFNIDTESTFPPFDQDEDEEEEEEEEEEVAIELSQLQILLIMLINKHGGSLAFEQMVPAIRPHISKVRRRDGTGYNADPTRAIQTSLSNVSQGRPLFLKDKSKKEGLWSLTEKSKEFIEKNPIFFKPEEKTTAANRPKRGKPKSEPKPPSKEGIGISEEELMVVIQNTTVGKRKI